MILDVPTISIPTSAKCARCGKEKPTADMHRCPDGTFECYPWDCGDIQEIMTQKVGTKARTVIRPHAPRVTAARSPMKAVSSPSSSGGSVIYRKNIPMPPLSFDSAVNAKYSWDVKNWDDVEKYFYAENITGNHNKFYQAWILRSGGQEYLVKHWGPLPIDENRRHWELTSSGYSVSSDFDKSLQTRIEHGYDIIERV
jgi:hypothetical protein